MTKTIDPNIQAEVKKLEKSNFLDLLSSLSYRWEDEKEYENFDNYKSVVKKHLSKHTQLKLVGFTKTFCLKMRSIKNPRACVIAKVLKNSITLTIEQIG